MARGENVPLASQSERVNIYPRKSHYQHATATTTAGHEGPSYRVEKNLFSENQKSKLGFDWSECQHATHGDFDISEVLFSAKKSWGTFS